MKSVEFYILEIFVIVISIYLKCLAESYLGYSCYKPWAYNRNWCWQRFNDTDYCDAVETCRFYGSHLAHNESELARNSASRIWVYTKQSLTNVSCPSTGTNMQTSRNVCPVGTRGGATMLSNCNHTTQFLCTFAELPTEVGLKSGKIADFQISSSSTFRTKVEPIDYYARFGRHSFTYTSGTATQGGWCSQQASGIEFFQVNFYRTEILTGLALQGVNGRECSMWVTSFNVSYKSHGAQWVKYTNDSANGIFVGNTDATHTKELNFSRPFAAREIRIYPVGTGSTCTLRQDRYCLRLGMYALHIKAFSDSMIHLYSRLSNAAPRKKTILPSIEMKRDFHKDWPTGSYALPKPQSGCGHSTRTEWHHGYRLHDSITSMNISNMIRANLTHLRNSVSPFYFVEEFCTKKQRSTNNRGVIPFPPGKYCIYKVGADCPNGFQNGSLRFFENETLANRTWSHLNGTVPNHKVMFNASHASCCFIEVNYCCRSDNSSGELDLPKSMPFFLVPRTNVCPNVSNTNATMESIDFSIRSRMNDTRRIAFGVHPFIILFNSTANITTMRYHLCYYEPTVKRTTDLRLLLRIESREVNSNFPSSIVVLLLNNGSLIEYGSYSGIWYDIRLSANCTSFSTKARVKSSNGIAVYNGSFYSSPLCLGVVSMIATFQATVPAMGVVIGHVSLTLFATINVVIVLRNKDLQRLPTLQQDMSILKRTLGRNHSRIARDIKFMLISYQTQRELERKLQGIIVDRKEDPKQIHGIIGINILDAQDILSLLSRVRDIVFITGSTGNATKPLANKVALQYNLTHDSPMYRALTKMKEMKANKIVIIRSKRLKIPTSLASYLLYMSFTVSEDVVVEDRDSSSEIGNKLRKIDKNFTAIYFIINANIASNLFIAAMKEFVSPENGYLWISGSDNGVFEQGIGSQACYKHKPLTCSKAFQRVLMINSFQTIGTMHSFIDADTRRINFTTLQDERNMLHNELLRAMILDGAAAIASSILQLSQKNLTITTTRILRSVRKSMPMRLQNFRFQNISEQLPASSSITCLNGWDSINCSSPQCSSRQCLSSGGKCVGSRLCECFSGFYGRSCAGVCKNLCKNGVCNEGAQGDGACISCSWMYEGKYCNKATVLQALITGCIGSLVLIVIVACFLPNCCRAKQYNVETGDQDESHWIIQWKELEDRQKVDLNRSVVERQFSEKIRNTSYFKAKFQQMDVFVTSMMKKPVKLSLEVRMEIKIAKDLNHSNIEKIKAVCLGPPYVAIVTELASMGSLYDTLHAGSVEIPVEIKYALMEDISRGMLYLHEECAIAHGRLKSTNCLIHRGWQLKITDVGLGSLRKNNESGNCFMYYKNCSYSSGIEKQDSIRPDYNSLLWTAPEYLGPGIVNLDQIENVKFEADVYSFGIIMVEILTRMPPYGEIKVMTTQHIIEAVAHLKEPMVDLELIRPGSPRAGKEVMAKKAKILRPSIRGGHLPVYEPKKNVLKVLIDSLWSDDPENRPSFSHITTVLRKISPLKGDKLEKSAFLFEKEAELLERYIAQDTKLIDKEQEKVNEYLVRSLPLDIYNEIQEGEDINAILSDDISVAAFRLADFQEIIKRSSPDELMSLMDYLIKSFQAVACEYRLELTEINVISDICIVESSNETVPDLLLKYCTKMLEITDGLRVVYNNALSIRFSVALHCGRGVTGLTHDMDDIPRYRVVSKEIDTTLTLLDKSSPSCILITDTFANLLQDKGNIAVIQLATKRIEAGKNPRTYWLVSI